MCLPKREPQNSTILVHTKIMDLDFQHLIKAQHAYECHCISSLQKPSCTTTTPVMVHTMTFTSLSVSTSGALASSQKFSFTRLVCTDCPVLWKVVVMVQLM